MHADPGITKPSFLFIHGFSGSSARWMFQLEDCRALGEVLAVNLPGHGGMPWHGETLAQMADGVSAALDQAGMTRDVIVVASSFGGLVTLDLWQKRPEIFRSIVFAGSVPRFTWTADFPAGLNDEKIRSLRWQLAHDMNTAMDVFFRSLFTPRERAGARYAQIKQARKSATLPSLETLNAFLDILGTQDSRGILRTVNVPVDFILGDADHICPLAVIDPLKELCPQARIRVMAGCGHLPFLTEPEIFNAFLKEHVS